MHDARYGADAPRPPMDTPVTLIMDDGTEFVGRRIYVEDDDGCMWAWATEDEHEPNMPECWTDGVCWGSNEYEQSSKQPRWWRERT